MRARQLKISKFSTAYKAALLGDSITLRCGPCSSDSFPISGAASPALPETAAFNKYSTLGWWHWFNAYMGQRFRPVVYAGVSGDTLSQMDARVAMHIIAYTPDVCFIQSSGNGIAGALTAAAEFASLQSICNKLLSANIVPIVSMPGPNANIGTESEIQEFVKLCHLISEYGRTGKIVLFDLYRGMIDYAAANVIMLSAYSDDSTHPTAIGASHMGMNAYNDLHALFSDAQVFTPFNSPYLTGNTNVMNTNNAGTGTVTGTGVVGTVGDGFKLSGTTSGTSLVTGTAGQARTDRNLGEETSLVFSGTAAAGSVEIAQYEITTPLANSVTGFSTGDKVTAYIEMTLVTALVNVRFPNVRWYWNSNNTTTKELLAPSYVWSENAGQKAVFALPEVTLGTEGAANTCTILVEFQSLAAGVLGGEIKIGRLCFRKLS